MWCMGGVWVVYGWDWGITGGQCSWGRWLAYGACMVHGLKHFTLLHPRGNECRDAGAHSEHGWQEGADAARCAHGTLVVALVVHGLVHG